MLLLTIAGCGEHVAPKDGLQRPPRAQHSDAGVGLGAPPLAGLPRSSKYSEYSSTHLLRPSYRLPRSSKCSEDTSTHSSTHSPRPSASRACAERLAGALALWCLVVEQDRKEPVKGSLSSYYARDSLGYVTDTSVFYYCGTEEMV